mgnify:CR=1 FL=1
MDIKDIWQRIEVWLEQNAPEIRKMLNGETAEEHVKGLEARLGLTGDLKNSLAIHDGQSADFYPRALIEQWELLSAERMQEEWLFLKDFYDSGEFADNKVS